MLTPHEKQCLESNITRFNQCYVVELQTGCWIWISRYFNKKKYGQFWDALKRTHVYAHKWSYEHFVGPVPAGKELMHTCRNACANWEHVTPGTHAENMFQTRKQFCINGHDTYKVGRTQSYNCRQCQKDYNKEYARRNRS